MAYRVFVKVDGLPGDSADAVHAQWIEAISLTHGVEGLGYAVSSVAGGAAADRGIHHDYTIVKYVDRASPRIWESCSSGKHFKEVVIEIVSDVVGASAAMMRTVLSEVLISNVSTNGNVTSEGPVPTETVSFSYGKIRWVYNERRAQGAAGGDTTGGWDVAAHKVFTGS